MFTVQEKAQNLLKRKYYTLAAVKCVANALQLGAGGIGVVDDGQAGSCMGRCMGMCMGWCMGAWVVVFFGS